MDELADLEIVLANIDDHGPELKNSPSLEIIYFVEIKRESFRNRTMSTSGGTVVYGCDSAYGKDRVLSFFLLFCSSRKTKKVIKMKTLYRVPMVY